MLRCDCDTAAAVDVAPISMTSPGLSSTLQQLRQATSILQATVTDGTDQPTAEALTALNSIHLQLACLCRFCALGVAVDELRAICCDCNAALMHTAPHIQQAGTQRKHALHTTILGAVYNACQNRAEMCSALLQSTEGRQLLLTLLTLTVQPLVDEMQAAEQINQTKQLLSYILLHCFANDSTSVNVLLHDLTTSPTIINHALQLLADATELEEYDADMRQNIPSAGLLNEHVQSNVTKLVQYIGNTVPPTQLLPCCNMLSSMLLYGEEQRIRDDSNTLATWMCQSQLPQNLLQLHIRYSSRQPSVDQQQLTELRIAILRCLALLCNTTADACNQLSRQDGDGVVQLLNNASTVMQDSAHPHPTYREWLLFTLRAITKYSPSATSVLRELRAEEVVNNDELAHFGMRADIDPATGAIRIKQLDNRGPGVDESQLLSDLSADQRSKLRQDASIAAQQLSAFAGTDASAEESKYDTEVDFM